MDDPLILNEVISWCKARKEQLLMLKLIFRKRLTRLGGIILTTFLASSVSESNGVGGFVVVFNLLKLRFWSTAHLRINFLFIEGYGKEIPFLPSFLSSSWRVCMFLFKCSSIEDMVSNEEIKRAVWDCGSDKSPGPDGFTFEFFKKFWTIVGGDVTNAIKEFFISSSFPKGCNSSFIALIPKVMDVKHLKDFMPISLIGCQYKIIGKILANHLSLVIGDIVSQEQSAFIKGKQIMDGPLILNEVISWCKARKEQLLMFKVDFQKAFDSVRWDHLDDILGKYGFGIKWRGWIRGCL
nr:cysteine-rich receptor-like protein kinase [Tanacetum cinerariifolium]